MRYNEREVPANFVPAAAVKRRGQVLFGMTGRKGPVGGFADYILKSLQAVWGDV